jgi:hypothetical protein
MMLENHEVERSVLIQNKNMITTKIKTTTIICEQNDAERVKNIFVSIFDLSSLSYCDGFTSRIDGMMLTNTKNAQLKIISM